MSLYNWDDPYNREERRRRAENQKYSPYHSEHDDSWRYMTHTERQQIERDLDRREHLEEQRRAEAAEQEAARRAALTPEQRAIEDAKWARQQALAEAKQQLKIADRNRRENHETATTLACLWWWRGLAAGIALAVYIAIQADPGFWWSLLIVTVTMTTVMVARGLLQLILPRWVAAATTLALLAGGVLLTPAVVGYVTQPRGPAPPIPAAVQLECRGHAGCKQQAFAVGESIPLSVIGLNAGTFKELCRRGYTDQRIDTQTPGKIYPGADGNCQAYNGSSAGNLDLSNNWTCPVPGPWTTTWQLLDPTGAMVLQAAYSGTCYQP